MRTVETIKHVGLHKFKIITFIDLFTVKTFISVAIEKKIHLAADESYFEEDEFLVAQSILNQDADILIAEQQKFAADALDALSNKCYGPFDACWLPCVSEQERIELQKNLLDHSPYVEFVIRKNKDAAPTRNMTIMTNSGMFMLDAIVDSQNKITKLITVIVTDYMQTKVIKAISAEIIDRINQTILKAA